jgi:hypothetical protein
LVARLHGALFLSCTKPVRYRNIKSQNLKKLLFLLKFILVYHTLISQTIAFNYEKLPVQSGFKMDGYWIWDGSMVKVDSLYHLFASRWPKTGPFPEGYRDNSEIVHAVSKSPLGPFVFKEVVIGERDSSYWDSNMAHNPTIHKIGDEYVLFYIGSDFSTHQGQSNALLRRVGYAVSSSIYGPWKRSDKPLINTDSNNPAILDEGSKIKLLYRDGQLHVFLAEAPNYKGPYIIKNDNVWPNSKLEDFYMFKSGDGYHIICEDNAGAVSGHERWGIHLYSKDGISNWKKYDPVVAYDHDIVLENDSVLHCARRERPQLLIENNKITYLITAIYDGKNSWSQPVKLKQPVKVK